MTSSRPPVAARRGPARTPRRNAPHRTDGAQRRLRPAFLYALAAAAVMLAVEWPGDRHASAADTPRTPRRSLARRAAVDRDAEGAGLAPAPWEAAATVAPSRPRDAAPSPEPAPAEQEPAQEQDDDPAISPDDWKPPPPQNPDPAARPAIDEVSPGSGDRAGGARIRVRGRNLEPVLVLFGRTPAPILTIDESGGGVTLTVIAPPRTGQGREWIVVVNRDGSQATARFEYSPPEGP